MCIRDRFNFEIQQSRSLSTCELNAVSRTSPHNELKSRHGFAYYEPLTPRERPKQQITAFSPTTSNLIMAGSSTQGTQEVSPTQDQATTPASRVPSTQPTTTEAPGKWFAKSKGPHSPLGNWKPLVDLSRTLSRNFFIFTWVLCDFPKTLHLWHLKEFVILRIYTFFVQYQLSLPLHKQMSGR